MRNPAMALGSNRVLRVEELGNRMIERNPRLAEHREWLQRRIAREELQAPGALERYFMALMMGHVPARLGTGYRARLGMLPPGNLPPVPIPPQGQVAVVLLEHPATPQLSAITEAPAATMVEETASAHLPTIEIPEMPYQLIVKADPAHYGPDEFGVIALPSSLDSEGTPLILGRGDFPFLSREASRVLSRTHLELRRNPDGTLGVRNLSLSSWGGPLLQNHGTWLQGEEMRAIDSENWTRLERNESLILGNTFEPIHARLVRDTTPQRVSLRPGTRANLNGAQLVRDGQGSQFRLLVFGDTQAEITRSWGDHVGEPQHFSVGDNPLFGEIGEEVAVSVTRNGQRRDYRLLLDAPDRPMNWLPQVFLQYHQASATHPFRFRATEPQLGFGKAAQPDLFSAQWISRRHFSLRVVSHLGQPRYLLTADSRFGLVWGGQRLQHNQSVLLYSGTHELGFLMNEQSTAVDGPLILHLPPIEGIFPEWGVEPLAPSHDRAMPPVPPPLPRTNLPPAPQTPPEVPRAWWRRILRR